jgi:hypothetical protein
MSRSRHLHFLLKGLHIPYMFIDFDLHQGCYAPVNQGLPWLLLGSWLCHGCCWTAGCAILAAEQLAVAELLLGS